MKSWIFTIAVIISAAFYCPISFSIENPGIGNPIGPSTVPPSTVSSGLVNNPSPIDMKGNLLITGNVRRGRYFHGEVPYQSPTSFGSRLGSSALSSFLRDTAGSEDFRANSNKYGTQPYYSPTETVSTMMPGRSRVFKPAGTRISTRVQQNTRVAETDAPNLEFQPIGQSSSGRSASRAGLGLQRPTAPYGTLAQSRLLLESKFPMNISHDSRNTRQLMPAQTGMRRQGESSDGELFKEQLQDITGRSQPTGWPGIDSTTGHVPEQQGNVWEKDESFKYQTQETNIENAKQKYNVQTYNQALYNNAKQTTSAHQGISALEQFKPSTDITSQKNLFTEKGTNWSAANRESQTVKKPIPERERQQGDVLERIRRQLDDLTKALNATAQSHDAYKDLNTETTAQQEKASLGYKQYLSDSQQVFPRDRIGPNGNLDSNRTRSAEISFEGRESAPVTNGGFNRVDRSGQAGPDLSKISRYENSQKTGSPLQQFNQLSQAEISAEASRIMGPYKSLESLSKAKFDRHIGEAQEHLKAGRYYRAASSFSLALIYQADNPRALAGRGHALLAVGEYVSSSLFLSRALEVSPEYLQTKVDLAAVLGGENKLADRIADIEQWLARSDSSQLQFLLGYVYYRTGQLFRAKQAIDAAYKKTPDSPAVRVMKITVDNLMIRQ
jgi:tetratricopeptide (TPR) repeat protein